MVEPIQPAQVDAGTQQVTTQQTADASKATDQGNQDTKTDADKADADKNASILDRVSKQATTQVTADTTTNGTTATSTDTSNNDILSGSGFNRQQWDDKLASLPEDQRNILESAYKSLQKGANVSFQQAAEIKKQYESNVQKPWTVDRVNDLTADPEFARAAQEAAKIRASQNNSAGELTDEDWSTLTATEKNELKIIRENQVQLNQMLQSQATLREDDQLKTTYAAYNPDAVTQLQTQLMDGRVNATREHLFKVLDYEDAVNRAYKLGREDEQSGIQHNVTQASTQVGGTTTFAENPPEKVEGETNLQHWHKVFNWRKTQFQKKSTA